MAEPAAGARTSDELDRILYEGDQVRIGRFRCTSDHPRFRDTGPIHADLMVFPRTSIWITHAGRPPILTDPTVVMFYNRRQLYTRREAGSREDHCEWFALPASVILEACRNRDPRHQSDGRPFRFTHGPSDSGSYLLQRTIVEHVERRSEDTLFVEESVLALLERVVAAAYTARNGRREARGRLGRGQHERVEAVRELLARRYHQRLTLDEIGRQVGCSPYHLCRLFRRATGRPIHAYRTDLRLRASLERVAGRRGDLTQTALELGFSSHSHFTRRFRATFGLTPARFRQLATGSAVREMSKIVTAGPRADR